MAVYHTDGDGNRSAVHDKPLSACNWMASDRHRSTSSQVRLHIGLLQVGRATAPGGSNLCFYRGVTVPYLETPGEGEAESGDREELSAVTSA